MTQEFSLDQKKITLLVALVLVLVLLIFIAGYLSGTIVGLPESEEPPVVMAPVVKPRPKPPVEAIPVPQLEAEPEPEEVEAVTEPEPEEVAPPEKLYSVQVGAFRTQALAEVQKRQLVKKGYQPNIYHGANSKNVQWYTLRIGDFDEVDEAIRAAREFRSLESSDVVLTHFDSLMMVRDDNGKRIEIAPPEAAELVEESPVEVAADEPEPVADEPEPVADEPEPVADEPEPVADEPEPVADEPEPVADEPEPVADEPEPVADEPEPVADEPEPVADEPEPVADEPEPVADEPEPVADEPEPVVDEPEPVVDEPEPVVDEPEPVVEEPAAVTDEPDSATGNTITFTLPVVTSPPPGEAASEEKKGVGGLIVAAETYQFAVQVGAFLNDDNAVKFTEKLRGRGYPAYVFHYTDTSGNAWSAVRTGDFKDMQSAGEAAAEFEEKENITAIVTRIDKIKMVMVK